MKVITDRLLWWYKQAFVGGSNSQYLGALGGDRPGSWYTLFQVPLDLLVLLLGGSTSEEWGPVVRLNRKGSCHMGNGNLGPEIDKVSARPRREVAPVEWKSLGLVLLSVHTTHNPGGTTAERGHRPLGN